MKVEIKPWWESYGETGCVEAEEMDTTGEHSYLVGTLCGGLMECPDRYITDHQVIKADTKDEARDKYNKINKCSFYYGHVIGQIDEGNEIAAEYNARMERESRGYDVVLIEKSFNKGLIKNDVSKLLEKISVMDEFYYIEFRGVRRACYDTVGFITKNALEKMNHDKEPFKCFIERLIDGKIKLSEFNSYEFNGLYIWFSSKEDKKQ